MAKQSKMYRYDSDCGSCLDVDFGNDCAARFQPRKCDLMNVTYDAAPEEQDVPVPVMRLYLSRNRDQHQASLMFKTSEVQQPTAIAETPIGLL